MTRESWQGDFGSDCQVELELEKETYVMGKARKARKASSCGFLAGNIVCPVWQMA